MEKNYLFGQEKLNITNKNALQQLVYFIATDFPFGESSHSFHWSVIIY